MRKIHILHKRWIEAVIVTLLLGILLTLFIPKFIDAQINVKIAQAKADTERVMQAVQMLQQEADRALMILYSVNLYNDEWGDTKQKIYFRMNPKDENTGNNTIEYSVIRQSFIDLIGEFPVQRLPVAISQDENATTYRMSKEGITIYDDHVFHSGFTYEKSPYNYRMHGLIDIDLNDKFPSITIPHNKPDLVITPGPVLLPVKPRNVVYDPTNGMMSHGFIVHHNY